MTPDAAAKIPARSDEKALEKINSSADFGKLTKMTLRLLHRKKNSEPKVSKKAGISVNSRSLLAGVLKSDRGGTL